MKIFSGLAEIPAFDDSNPFPSAVDNFIYQVGEADAVLFCIPEYAFGVPGALKNALDWTVSSGDFYEKPVAVFNASPRASIASRLWVTTIDEMRLATTPMPRVIAKPLT